MLISLLLLIYTIHGSQSFCNYFQHSYWGYACELEGISYLNQSEAFSLEGIHVEGNNDSTVLTVFTTASNMSYIPDEILKKFENLETLLLSQSKMLSIDKAFEKCGNIQTMTFYRNELTNVEPETFQTCTELTSLDLSENQITILSRGVFEMNTKLESLIIDSNPIKVIDPVMFRTLTNLKILWMLNLDVSELDFSFYTDLKKLERSGAGSRFPNNITIIRKGTFKSMPALQALQLINDNQEPMEIEDGAFENLPNLTQLVLSGNAIEKLSSKSFVNVANLLYFTLENNWIQQIERDFFDNFPNLRQLLANGNPCGNKSYYFESGFEEEYLPDFEECFLKYENNSTTSTTTGSSSSSSSTTEENTTLGSPSLVSRLLKFYVMLCTFIALVNFYKNF